jgi:hypothetical protein
MHQQFGIIPSAQHRVIRNRDHMRARKVTHARMGKNNVMNRAAACRGGVGESAIPRLVRGSITNEVCYCEERAQKERKERSWTMSVPRTASEVSNVSATRRTYIYGLIAAHTRDVLCQVSAYIQGRPT